MNYILRKLPIGIQTFEKLITGGYIYIDKTAILSRHLSAWEQQYGKDEADATRLAPLGSVFGDLNQWNDLSLHLAYATLCEFTKEELTRYFSPELEQLAISLGTTPEEVTERVLRQYGGYHFHPQGTEAMNPQSISVMNPYSVLHAFDKQELGSYWFRTASPAYQVELLQESDYDMLTFLDGIETSLSSFTDYQADANNPLPLIYQSGYLTIKDYDPEFLLYRLGFPNDEVKHGFLNYLLPYYSSVNESAQNLHISRLVQDLRAGDADAFLNRIKVFFSDFPYELNEKNECHYQLVLCLVLKLVGQFMEVEVRCVSGGVEAVVNTPEHIFVFKFHLHGTAEEALQQMNDKAYLFPYVADGREVVKVGVELCVEERNVHFIKWMEL